MRANRDVWFVILQKLPPIDVIRCRSVCRLFRELFNRIESDWPYPLDCIKSTHYSILNAIVHISDSEHTSLVRPELPRGLDWSFQTMQFVVDLLFISNRLVVVRKPTRWDITDVTDRRLVGHIVPRGIIINCYILEWSLIKVAFNKFLDKGKRQVFQYIL